MKSKLLLFALLLMGVSVGAQTESVSISDDCSKNGMWGVENNHQWVDLGLSVKWATMNVGATIPEDYGKHYAWGEVTTKSNYTWSTYKYCNGSSTSMTKYCTNSSYGTVDNKTSLEIEDDAANINWGGNWRMPTKEEWEELRTQCTWRYNKYNGVLAYKVTGSNGNFIIIPLTGFRNGTSRDFTGAAYYWISSLSTGNPQYAAFFYFDSTSYYKMTNYRYYGYCIRPVCP